MKNIFLGLFVALALLPQVSFGATTPPAVVNPPTISDPTLIAFQKQQDAESIAFFQQQVQERIAFINANQSLMGHLDAQGKALWLQKNALRNQKNGGVPPTIPTPPPLSVQESSTMSAFTAQQLSEKQAFFQKLAQEKQTFLNSSTAK